MTGVLLGSEVAAGVYGSFNTLTVPTGTRLLWFFVGYFDTAQRAPLTITLGSATMQVKHNGFDMHDAGNTGRGLQVYILIDPPTGTQTLAASSFGTMSLSGAVAVYTAGIYNGVTGSSAGTATHADVYDAAQPNESWLAACIIRDTDDSQSLRLNSDATQIAKVGLELLVASSTTPDGGNGHIGYVWGSGANNYAVMASMLPAAPPTQPSVTGAPAKIRSTTTVTATGTTKTGAPTPGITTGGKCRYLANAILDHVLGRTIYTPPTTIYLALSTATFTVEATGSDLNEVTGNGYARVAIPNDASSWTAADATSLKLNIDQLTFPGPTGSWGTVRSYYLLDAANGGHALYGANLAAATAVPVGAAPFIAPGAIAAAEY